MPDISGAGTFTAATAGFSVLAATDKERVFVFAGSSLGDSTSVQYIDDAGTPRTPEGGVITALPRSFTIKINQSLQIVTTGSADFNVTVSL